MSRVKRVVAVMSIAVFAAVSVGIQPAFAHHKKCAPGHHGNPHPGFKPGSCKR